MKLHDLKAVLRNYPGAHPRLILPDGDAIPAHYHITEVGHVAKRFIDCGGKVHEKYDRCVLQTWVADDVDHRLDAETFAKILDLGKAVLPSDDLEVEVEYDCCVTAQYPIREVHFSGETLDIQLAAKHTNCLARERCGLNGESCEDETEPVGAGCC